MEVSEMERPVAELVANDMSMWEEHPDAGELDPIGPAAWELLPREALR